MGSLNQAVDQFFNEDNQKFLSSINTLSTRVTSLEQLSVAEFRGEETKPKVYENGHKKVLGIWFDLVLKVKCSKIFLCQKSAESLRFLFH